MKKYESKNELKHFSLLISENLGEFANFLSNFTENNTYNLASSTSYLVYEYIFPRILVNYLYKKSKRTQTENESNGFSGTLTA